MLKGLAELGGMLGREFSYALLQVVSPWDEETLRRGLHQLVEAEFLYQQGLPPQATYRLQACPDPGGRLSVVAAEHPAAVPSVLVEMLQGVPQGGIGDFDEALLTGGLVRERGR